MLSIEYKEAFVEVLAILNHTRKEDYNKISPKFIKFLEENCSKTYKPVLDYTKPIKDLNLKHKTRVVLTIIYQKFGCNSESRKKFNRILRENSIKREKELREKYNPDDIFKKRCK